MVAWQIWTIIGFLFLFVELTVPTLFFLNLAVGTLFTAMSASFIPNVNIQIVVFVVASAVSLLFLRPFLLKSCAKEEEAGIEGKYIGNQAQVINKIGEEGTDGIGKIKIYGEVWDARTEDGSSVEPFEMVEIIRNESSVMFVRKPA